MHSEKYLADVNVLIALVDEGHEHHMMAKTWFDTSGHSDWGVCAFTEAGFLRVTANSKLGSLSVVEATRALAIFAEHPGYRFWPMSESWVDLVEPFCERVFGHQQITDAYLLGLVVRAGGVLVTMDKGIQYMAGAKYGQHVLVLE